MIPNELILFSVTHSFHVSFSKYLIVRYATKCQKHEREQWSQPSKALTPMKGKDMKINIYNMER